MPSSAEILEGLQRIANGDIAFSAIWHGLVAAAVLGLDTGWRPTKRLAAVLLALPPASAALFAFLGGNPFNGGTLTALTLALLLLAGGLPDEPVAAGPGWSRALGIALIALAWCYPHFLEGRPWIAYLYAAPMGLIPCPTLALVAGFTLVAGGLGSRGWMLAVAAAAVFYGLFGAARLGVLLDVALLAGALGLALLAAQYGARRTPTPA